MDAEQYRLEVTDRAQVTGGSYAGVAAGTVTLLQALSAGDGAVALPRVTVADAPYASYRGLLVDPARHFHTPDMLRQCGGLTPLSFCVSFGISHGGKRSRVGGAGRFLRHAKGTVPFSRPEPLTYWAYSPVCRENWDSPL